MPPNIAIIMFMMTINELFLVPMENKDNVFTIHLTKKGELLRKMMASLATNYYASIM